MVRGEGGGKDVVCDLNLSCNDQQMYTTTVGPTKVLTLTEGMTSATYSIGQN